MATIYLWKGKNPKGKKIKGEMEAESQEQVRLSLERRKINVTSIKKKPKDLFENIEFLQAQGDGE